MGSVQGLLPEWLAGRRQDAQGQLYQPLPVQDPDGNDYYSRAGGDRWAQDGSHQIVPFSNSTTVDLVTSSANDIYSFHDVARACHVFSRGLQPNPEVVVAVGPVVGHLTDTEVVVLLELKGPPGACFDCAINLARVHNVKDIECVRVMEPNLSAFDLENLYFRSQGSVTVHLLMYSGVPRSVSISNLTPSTGYVAFLSGVTQRDIKSRVAFVTTLPAQVERLRFVAFAGDEIEGATEAASESWSRLAKALRRGPSVAFSLHVGSTVDSRASSAEAVLHLRGYGSFQLGARKELEQRARAEMQRAFRHSWGQHEGLPRILAECGAQLCVFAPPLEEHCLNQFVNYQSVGDERADLEVRALLRQAVHVAREYQRVLWQPRESVDHEQAGVVTPQSEAPSERQRMLPKILSSFPFDRSDAGDSALPTGEYFVFDGPREAPSVEDWHIHRYGPIYVLALDTKGNRCSLEEGGPDASSALLSTRQWAAVRDVLDDDLARVLVLASDVPFFLGNEDLGVATVTGDSSVSAASEASSLPRLWRSNPDELVLLLTSLFEWKNKQYPVREVLLVSGSLGYSTYGSCRDHHFELSIPSIVVGPTGGTVRLPRHTSWTSGHLSNGRFTFEHGPATSQRTACVVDLDVGQRDAGSRPWLDVQLLEL